MRALLPTLVCATALAACAGEGKAPPRPEAGAPSDTGESPVDSGAGAVDCAAAPLDCDLQDNDCDGEIDEGAEGEARIWVGVDADDDGWAAGPVVLACPGTGGASTPLLGPGDCDDDEPRFNPGAEEICRSAADEDCDGEGACGDLDCAGLPCFEDCTDGLDNDVDGQTDCADSTCRYEAVCDEDCADGLDNDVDGYIDCSDYNCIWDAACAEHCFDGVDNNDDGAVDCDDARCRVPDCPELCADGIDNDGDRRADCGDADCASPSCIEACFDGVDNDADGATDCSDTECWGARCHEVCTNPGDEDADGLADCEDADCVVACTEDCRGGDHDRDGLIGCDDPDCGLQIHCWTDLTITEEALSLRRGLFLEPRSGATASVLRQDLTAELLRIDGVAHTAAGAPLPCAVELRDLVGVGQHAVYPSFTRPETWDGSAFSGSTVLPSDPGCPRTFVLELGGLIPDALPSPSATWAIAPGALFTVISIAQGTPGGGGGSLLQMRVASPATYTVTPLGHPSITWDRRANQTLTGPLSLAPHP